MEMSSIYILLLVFAIPVSATSESNIFYVEISMLFSVALVSDCLTWFCFNLVCMCWLLAALWPSYSLQSSWLLYVY